MAALPSGPSLDTTGHYIAEDRTPVNVLFQTFVKRRNNKASSVQTVVRCRNFQVFQLSGQWTFHCKCYTIPVESFQNMLRVNLFPERPSENAVLELISWKLGK
jgi:hypothetical protein